VIQSQVKYSQLISSLLYVSNRTRLDIAYTVGRLIWYTINPNKEYQTALERVFRYLRGIIGYYLIYT